MRRATATSGFTRRGTIFQSTLSMRRATLNIDMMVINSLISIHALHEESDTLANGIVQNNYIFQSTLSMRRATRWGAGHSADRRISIHALHEESDAPSIR